MAVCGKSAVGIDFGYSSIRAAVFTENGDEFEILCNETGNPFTPAFIKFHGSNVIMGERAINHEPPNAENLVYGIKGLMGRLKDEALIAKLKELPFAVDVSNDKIKVIISGDTRKSVYSPEEITALFLITIKCNAEEYLKKDVDAVVLSVPPNFRNSQRQSLIDSALIAGFKNVQLLSDTVALTLKHCWKNENYKQNEKNKILSISIGGGYTSISIIEINGGRIEVKEHNGKDFGGGEFDKYSYRYILDSLPNQSDLSDEQKQNLWKQCEACKIALSSTTTSAIELEELLEQDFSHVEKVTRKQFEDACEELFNSIFNKIMETIETAKIDRREINEVLLVGGPTQMPKIGSFISETFSNAIINSHNNDAVAIGCLLYSNIIQTKTLEIRDISTFWYCVEYNNCNLVIEKNSELPMTVEGEVVAKSDTDRYFSFKVVEVGTNAGTLIGDFTLQTKNCLKNGHIAFNVTLKIDSNGTLSLRAVESITKKKFALYTKPRLTKDEIKWMTIDANKMRVVFKEEIVRLRAKESLKTLIREYQGSISDLKEVVEESEAREAEEFLNLISKWLEICEYTRVEYTTKLADVEEYFTALLAHTI